jgi:putative membrane protein
MTSVNKEELFMVNRIVRGATLPLVLAAFSSMGLVGIAAAQNANNNMAGTSSGHKLTAADRQFVKKAAQGGMAEVELGQLATEKAASPEVKQFGQRMVDDHTKANDQLKQVASEEGVTIPDKLDAKDAATKARLEKLSGKAFDRAYMHDMVLDHTKDVSEFRMEAKNASDPAVKNFAKETLPTLESHLKEAKSIAPKTTKTARTTKTSAAGGTQ